MLSVNAQDPAYYLRRRDVHAIGPAWAVARSSPDGLETGGSVIKCRCDAADGCCSFLAVDEIYRIDDVDQR